MPRRSLPQNPMVFRDGESVRTLEVPLPKTEERVAGLGSGLQASRHTHDSGRPLSSDSQGQGADPKDFAPILLPEDGRAPKGRRAPARLGDLLSVREVARRLRVCEATVYKLCARGLLSHVRVLNAVRIAPEAVEAFTGRR
jgi:excisionase family DNA binding protein